MADNVVCITVYYKNFTGSKKKKKFFFAKTEILVACYILFSLALESGSFLLNSSPVPQEKVCVRSADKEVYNH